MADYEGLLLFGIPILPNDDEHRIPYVVPYGFPELSSASASESASESVSASESESGSVEGPHPGVDCGEWAARGRCREPQGVKCRIIGPKCVPVGPKPKRCE